MTRQEQRTQAQIKANRVRAHQAALRQRLRGLPPAEAFALARDVLADPTAHHADAMRIEPLLRALPRVGDRRLRLLMGHVGLAGVNRRLRDFTPRQRRLIADALDLPSASLRAMHPAWRELVIDRTRAQSVAASLAATRPDIQNPQEVVRLVLEHDAWLVETRRAAA